MCKGMIGTAALERTLDAEIGELFWMVNAVGFEAAMLELDSRWAAEVNRLINNKTETRGV